MMIEVLSFLVGLLIVLYVMQAAVRTVILPRAANMTLSAGVFHSVAHVFRWVAARRKTYEAQDGVLAVIGPVGLLAVTASWMILLLVGFGFMFWSTESDLGVGGAFNLAGSSITTLGFAPASGSGQRALAFTAALLGLLILTLFITYLPSIYAAFQTRENRVALLEVRAGSPADAHEMLIRFHRIGWTDELSSEWLAWEPWFMQLEETHTTYAALPWFRSTDHRRSWVTASGAVLDAAALWLSAVTLEHAPHRAAAGLMIRSGYVSLRRIADSLNIGYDPDPHPGDPIAILRSEFDAAVDEMRDAGIPVVADRDQAWADFAGWRINYEAALLGLAEMLRVPYAPWTSDRSSLEPFRRERP
ncbi:MAG: hypothetical protein BMS9Abin17_0249 [Acidimicrobiia bacterium]|nr:MAG: hypothetical protein BMS9Abin17_0249 [Acidimicrobiia bacterium]